MDDDERAEMQQRVAELSAARKRPARPHESPEARGDRLADDRRAGLDALNASADDAHARVIPVPAEVLEPPAPTLAAVLAFMAEAGCCDECEAKVRALDTANLVERLRKGREAKNGGWQTGNPPYGWRSRGRGHLEPVGTEQVVLDWIFRQREQGYGWVSIVSRLNEAGTPGPKGGRWHVSSLRLIVARGRGNPAGADSRSGATAP